jgi:hypothetical protein
MFKRVRQVFLSHPHNNYTPHLLREVGLVAVFLVVAGLFSLSSIERSLLTEQGSYWAAVLPAVLVDETNQERSVQGISGLTTSPVLTEAAQLKANDMARLGYFSHTTPSGQTPWYWFGQAGYDFMYAGENLAVNFFDSSDVTAAWMDSPGHRANLLNPLFTEVGIATAKGMYQGHETTFVVQLFGTPIPPNIATAGTGSTDVAMLPETSGDDQAAGAVSDLAVDEVDQSVAGTTTTSEDPKKESEGHDGDQAQEEREPEKSAAASPDSAETNTTYLKVLTEDKQFVAVVRVSQPLNSESATTSTTSSATVETTPVPRLPAERVYRVPQYAGFFSHLLSEPQKLYADMYFLLGALVGVSLLSLVLVEFRVHHVKNIAYAFTLLLLIGAAIYLNQHVVFASTVLLP